MTNETALRRLIDDEQRDELLADLKDLQQQVEDGEVNPAVEGWELALEFGAEDIPILIEELEDDDGG
jgi:hypothetical protein